MVEAEAHAQTSTIVLRRHVISTHVRWGTSAQETHTLVKTSGDGHNVAGSGIGVFHDVREQFPNHRTDQLPVAASKRSRHHRGSVTTVSPAMPSAAASPPASVNQASHGIRPSPRRYRPGTLP